MVVRLVQIGLIGTSTNWFLWSAQNEHPRECSVDAAAARGDGPIGNWVVADDD